MGYNVLLKVNITLEDPSEEISKVIFNSLFDYLLDQGFKEFTSFWTGHDKLSVSICMQGHLSYSNDMGGDLKRLLSPFKGAIEGATYSEIDLDGGDEECLF